MFYYTKDENGYCLYINEETCRIGEEIAIGFTTHPSYRKALLHRHGSVEDVGEWFDRSIAKIVRAGAPSLTEDVKMLVFSDINPDEINKMANQQEYLSDWLEKNDVNL